MTEPAMSIWRQAMAAEPYLYGRLARVEIERDQLREDLAVAQRQWALDVEALIEARQEIERQAIRIGELERAITTQKPSGGDLRG